MDLVHHLLAPAIPALGQLVESGGDAGDEPTEQGWETRIRERLKEIERRRKGK